MKPDHETRFTVIGLGNIMEVIWPGLAAALGGPDLAQRAAATTADRADLTRKREKFKIPVALEDNARVLRENRPDIIFFAPPPKAAPGLITGTLKEYYQELRAQNAPLPEIYALPPVPPGEFYRQNLGEDVLVVNLIPNNVREVAGVALRDEGFYSCTFAAPWPEASKARLQRAFAGQGAAVELKPAELIPLLGGTCVIFSLWQAVPVLADLLYAAGQAPAGPAGHNLLGEHMRAVLRGLSGYRPEGGHPASEGALTGPLAALSSASALGFRQGVAGYFQQVGFPPEASRTILARGFDIILHTVQKETRAVLDGHAIGAATKGGVLEKAIATFHALVKPHLAKAVGRLPVPPTPDWQGALAQLTAQTCHVVRCHGETLAG